MDKFPYTLVKFDKFLAHGEKHETFKKLAASVGSHDQLLIAEVHIQGYVSSFNSKILISDSFQRNNSHTALYKHKLYD